jgi:hypothetical protein
MGDEFIKKKSKSYRRQAEKVHAEDFNQSGIFTVVPERTSYVFRFKAPGVEPQPGEEIWLADVPGKACVRVLQGTTTIGEVDNAGSAKLRELIGEHEGSGGVLPGVVVSGKDVAGYAKAKVSL